MKLGLKFKIFCLVSFKKPIVNRINILIYSLVKLYILYHILFKHK